MRSYLPNVALFLLTIVSTLLVGGPVYSCAILAILIAHEGGHYLASRRHGVPASLPYFIPFPLPPFGTLGAIIRTKGVIPNRRALLDIGAAGPLSGLAVAVPAVVIGFLLSQVVDVSKLPPESTHLGNSPLLDLFQWLVIGELPPGKDVLLHPIAYAGWVGLFITSLNLLPIGQLDGGHIIYALFGERSRLIFRLTLLAITIICLFYNVGWLLLVIILIAIGYKHPRPVDDQTPLDWRRKVIGALAFALFFATFNPIPFPSLAIGLGEVLHSWLGL